MMFDATTGASVQQNFIVDDPTSVNYNFQSPKDAIQVGTEVWVSDQVSDAIYRFNPSGAFIAAITGGMDNVRRMELVGSTVYVANSGTNKGAPGQAIVMFSTAGAPLLNFAVPGPFDVVGFQGDLPITNIVGEHVERYTTAGAFVSTFHDSDGISGIDFPQQVSVDPSGDVTCAGFSSPAGLYEYDAATGTQLNYIAVASGPRGVRELGNGNLLFTDGTGVYIYDNTTLSTTTVLSGVSAQFIGEFNPSSARHPPCRWRNARQRSTHWVARRASDSAARPAPARAPGSTCPWSTSSTTSPG